MSLLCKMWQLDLSYGSRFRGNCRFWVTTNGLLGPAQIVMRITQHERGIHGLKLLKITKCDNISDPLNSLSTFWSTRFGNGPMAGLLSLVTRVHSLTEEREQTKVFVWTCEKVGKQSEGNFRESQMVTSVKTRSRNGILTRVRRPHPSPILARVRSISSATFVTLPAWF